MENANAQFRAPFKAGQKLEWLEVLFEDEALSATAKNIAWRLVRHHNDDTGQCNPKQITLAKGIGRKIRVANDAIRELREAGWIEVKQHRDGAHYVLVLDRAKAVETGEVRGIPHVRYAEDRVAGTRKTAQLVRGRPRTEPLPLTPERTPQPTSEPKTAAIEPETQGPAAQPVMPVQSATSPPTPANDDAVEGRTISGWTIPSETIREWKAGFRHIDLDSELTRSGSWFVANVPEKRRLSALASRLHKRNEANRVESLTRRENRQADADAGVEMDAYGRVKGRPAPNSRYAIPDAPENQKVHRGPGYSITRAEMVRIKAKWPELDVLAEIAAFDREQADAMIAPEQNSVALAAFLDAKKKAKTTASDKAA